MALLTVDQWANSVNGKYIDHDGFPAGNIYQCHDLWIDYLMRVAGGTQAMGYAPSGLTDSVFTNFPVNGLDAKVTRTSGTAGIRKGDVVFWVNGSANYPYSHVAVALAPPSGGNVLCMSQNPGPAQQLNLTLAGALGYLRPRNLPTDPTPQPDPQEITVKTYFNRDKFAPTGGRTVAPGAGFYLHRTSSVISAADNVIGGVGPYSLTAHVYAEGTPGDALRVFYVVQNQNETPLTNSPHFVERLVFDKTGRINANVEFKWVAGLGDAVFLRCEGDAANTSNAKVTVLGSDAYLFSVA